MYSVACWVLWEASGAFRKGGKESGALALTARCHQTRPTFICLMCWESALDVIPPKGLTVFKESVESP